ncbi:Ig-like domain-containing protein [Mesobacillus jeotgali]|uniref:Ig-like domain-containing protein n=1 Tax=Mesobacillus jeotgali TaxID=129985 RepID=UPI0009A5E56C|nr:Ig-like domain-containing protein [Mesobacillus jeotgali]
MLEPRKKKRRPNKWAIVLPILLVLISSVLVFNGRVWSNETEAKKYINFEGYQWEMKDQPTKDIWTKKDEVAFLIDLKEDYERVQDPIKINPTTNNPVSVTVKQSDNKLISDISITPVIQNDEFSGSYEVKIKSLQDGGVDINVVISENNIWGNSPSSNSFKVFKDSTSPVVKLLDPDGKPSSNFYDKDINLTVEVLEKNLKPGSIKIFKSKNDGPKELFTYENNDGESYTKTLTFDQNGEYTITVVAEDFAGNTVLPVEPLQLTVSKEDYKPEISVINQTDSEKSINEWEHVKTAKIGIKVESAVSIGTANLILLKDEKEEVLNQPMEKDGRTTKIVEYQIPQKPDGSYEDGKYTAIITVTDLHEKGKEHAPVSFTFIVDNTPPKYTYNVKNGNSYNESQNVEIVLDELNLQSAEVTLIETSIDGREDITKPTINNGIAKFEAVNDGEYTVKFLATDKAGNKNGDDGEPKFIKFKIDKEKKPDIFIETSNLFNEEINGKYFNDDTKIEFSVKDITLNLLETFLTVKKGSESYTEIKPFTELLFTGHTDHIFTKDGVYEIFLSSKDYVGSDNSVGPIKFTIDKTPPDLIITGLKEEEDYGGIQDFSVKVLDLNFDVETTKIIIKRDGEKLDYKPTVDLIEEDGKSGALFKYSFTDEGNYEIEFDIKDKAQNPPDNNTSVNFSIDKKPPNVKVSGVENNGHYRSVNFTVGLEDLTLDIKKGNPKVKVTKPDGKITEYSNWDEVKKDGRLKTTNQSLSFTDEGDYKVEFLGQDLKGNNISEEPIYFTIDTTSPKIKLNGISDNSFIKNGSVDLELTERNYKVSNIEVYYLLNGSEKKHKLSWKKTGEVSKESYPFSKDGDYEFYILVTDGAGNIDDKKIAFTIDNKPPTVDITKIKRYNNEPQKVTIRVTEKNYENNNVNITVTKKEEVGGKPVDYHIGEWKNVKEVSNLSHLFDRDGEYEITAEATDAAGNKGDTEKILFTIDKTDPTVNLLTDIENGQNYRTNMLVKMRAEDRNIDLSYTELKVEKNGKPYNVGKLKLLADSKTVAVNSYTFFDEGKYVINLKSTDKAGNTKKQDQIAFIIDKTNPVVKIDGVENNSFYPENKNVTISIDELNYDTNNVSISATKDGAGFPIGTWKNTGKLSKLGYNFTRDGLYTIHVTAEDKAGNGPITEKRTFTIDETKPEIEITGVENNAYYNVDKPVNVTIKDVNLDINKMTVTRNGARYNAGGFSVNGDLASFRHNFSGEGEYHILVEATDKAGNSFSKTMKFTIDKTKPVITPKFKGQNRVIKNGEYINEVFTPEFALDEAEDMIVTATLNNGANLGRNIPVAAREIKYTYKVLARDKAGNESTLEISFTLDTTKPMLNISGVLDGFFNKNIAPKVTYSDIHLDSSKTSVTLNGKTFENGTKLEYEQDYILKAVVTDLAKNVSSRTIVFTIDKTSPVIKFKEPISNKYFNSDLLPQLLIEDMSSYDIIAMMLDGKPYEAGEPIKEEGKHVMFFEVKDKAGNIQQLSVEFIIDKTAPKVVYEGVKNKQKYYDPVDVAIRLDNPNDKIKSVMINGEMFEGDVIEENGNQVIKTKLAKIQPYKIEVTAYDEAGNEKTTVIAFEIVEKGALVKFYENKPLLGGTVAGLVGLIGAAATMMVRRRKLKVEEE